MPRVSRVSEPVRIAPRKSSGHCVKHIHSLKKHKNWAQRDFFFYYFILFIFLCYFILWCGIPTLRRCSCHAWLPNIYVHHFSHTGFNVSAPRAAENKQADLKSTRLPNLLQILTYYASFAAGSPSTEQSQQLLMIGLCECIFFCCYPDITCHHLESICRERQILAARRKPTEAYSPSKEEKSPYLCFAAIPPMLFSRLEEICKYPWM